MKKPSKVGRTVVLAMAVVLLTHPGSARGDGPGGAATGGIIAGGVLLVDIPALVAGIRNAVAAANGERPGGGWLAVGYIASALSVVIGTAVVAENTRSEFHTIGGVMIGVGALSLISTIWAHTKPSAEAKALAAGLSFGEVGPAFQTKPQPHEVGVGRLRFEIGADRLGGDYRGFAQKASDPRECRDACASDLRCRAFTFARPGTRGPSAYCYLKDRVGISRPNLNYVSGIKE